MTRRLSPSLCALACAFALVGCSSADTGPSSQAFDLRFTHPSASSTYMRITAGSGGALPPVEMIHSPTFASFMAARTGCMPQAGAPVSALGLREAPRAYLVPVSCP